MKALWMQIFLHHVSFQQKWDRKIPLRRRPGSAEPAFRHRGIYVTLFFDQQSLKEAFRSVKPERSFPISKARKELSDQ